MTTFRTLLGGGLVLATASVVQAQATYTNTGNFRPNAISQDGKTAVGVDASTGDIVFYDVMTGNITPVSTVASQIDGISADGSMTCGTEPDINGDTNASRYDGTVWTQLGGLASQSGASISTAYDMSNDGSTVVGLGWLTAGQAGAFRWQSSTGMMESLGTQIPGDSSRANGTDGDGSLVVGWDDSGRRPAIWPAGAGSGMFIGSLTTGDPTAGGECEAATDDGSIVVGWSFNDLSVFEAFRYESGVMTGIGLHPGASPPSSQAFCVSDDGGLIGGLGGNAFFGFQRGFIWTTGTGLVDASTFLTNNGASVGADIITTVNGCSGDGKVLCGLSGSFPFFSGFIATLPPDAPTNYCTGKASTAGCVASMSTSNTSTSPVSGANDYSFVLNGAEGMRAGIFFTTTVGAGSAPFQGGTLCIAPPLKRSPVLFTGGTSSTCDGTFSLLVNDGNLIPPGGSGFDGGSGNFTWTQAWYRSPGLGDGFDTALSDGLETFWL